MSVARSLPTTEVKLSNARLFIPSSTAKPIQSNPPTVFFASLIGLQLMKE